jgi:acetyltransferase-like isoleucine patch superfamily enzyme
VSIQNKVELFLGKVIRRGQSQPVFRTKDVEIGSNVTFGRNVEITSRKVRIGDCVRIGDNVRIRADEFVIGDYGTLYFDFFAPGPGRLTIGHNFWAGARTIVDALGGTTIGNNVSVGPATQLWSHAILPDTLAGARFTHRKGLRVGDDVWFMAQCVVAATEVGSRSAALHGSSIVKEMAADRCYSGVPAVDVTEKVGGPMFRKVTPAEMRSDLETRIRDFKDQNPDYAEARVGIATESADMLEGQGYDVVFNVADRSYVKRATEFERQLMWHLLPTAKFVPAT